MTTPIVSPEIKEFLTTLMKSSLVRDNERRFWPRFAFHYTDIQNAVRILQAGCLYSRQYLERTNEILVSSGSDEILASTDSRIKDCVRLYFRPKTPTQFWAEGIRTKDSLQHSRFPDAHCPVPIFFLFDLAEILSRSDTEFSERGLGSQHQQTFAGVRALEKFDWAKIYHNGPVNMAQDRDIISYRNAEIIVPNQLDLTSLRYIYCRSVPELQTLSHLLPDELKNRYKNKIVSSGRSNLYYRNHTFLEDVRLSDSRISIQFAPDTQSKGPYLFKAQFLRQAELIHEAEALDFYVVNESGSARWQFPSPINEYEIRLYLDDALIYSNEYTPEVESPF